MTTTQRDTAPLLKEFIALGKKYEDYVTNLERENDELRENLLDIQAFQKTRKEETYPSEMARRLIVSGDHPLKIYREYRELSQIALSEKSGISQAIISGIENKKRNGTVENFKSLAKVLGVDIDSLID